jgi:hypothetical protein
MLSCYGKALVFRIFFLKINRIFIDYNPGAISSDVRVPLLFSSAPVCV